MTDQIDMFREAPQGTAPSEAFEPERGKCWVLQGDSEQPLPFLDNTFDSVITDPPYGLAFMGKKWDYDIPSVAAFAEQLRVAKPGATMLCFAGTRTQHRMACNIEDAGWRLFDTILWMYGTGFPKAADISKQIDKAAGAEREVVGKTKTKSGISSANGEVYDTTWGHVAAHVDITAPATEAADLWDGWKSHGLKPAYEPIICAMKPNDGTYAQNALRWGVAGLAIDRGRVGFEEGQTTSSARSAGQGAGFDAHNKPNRKYGKGLGGIVSNPHDQGRFPANIILGCACESAPPHEPGCACAMLDEQSGVNKGGSPVKEHKHKSNQVYGQYSKQTQSLGYNDIGGASRFYYCAKASRAERDMGLEDMPIATPGEITGGRKEGSAGLDSPRAGAGRTSGGRNTHATVKPLDLMRYLCRLTATPTGGLVLDPYAGSGTTGLAAVLEGRDCVLIEREPEYIRIAKLRTGAG